MEQILYACLILLSFGMSLRMSLRLLYGARGPQVDDPVHQMINAASWALMLIPLTAFIVVGTNWLSWLVLSVAALAGLELILARRSMQRYSVWKLIASAVSSSKPLAQTLQNHQGRFTGIVGRAFRKLVTTLQQGTSLSTAISEQRRAVPYEVQAYAATGAIDNVRSQEERSASLLRLESNPGSSWKLAAQQLYQRFSYLGTVLSILVAAIAFLAIQIIPSYQAIFDDFELELPLVTRRLIFITGGLSQGWAPYLIAIFFGGLLLLCFIVACLYLCDFPVLRPLTDRLFFSRHRSLILSLLATAAEQGQAFVTVLDRLVQGQHRYPSQHTRSRLRRVRKEIVRGHDWKQALLNSSIIRADEVPMLSTAEQSGNLPWVLSLLAEQKTRVMIFRWSVAEQIVFPLVIILLGLVVLFICVALFLPLVELTHSLT